MVIEANPRASRTVPYLSKAIGHPLAKYAALIAAGKTLAELGFTETPQPEFYSVKEVVLPFLKFKNVLPVLGPEMRSTGESMGIDPDPYLAYAKALSGANVKLPVSGTVLVLGNGLDEVKAELEALFTVITESSTEEPDYDLLIDTDHTPELRRALESGVPYVTTHDAACWLVKALRALREKTVDSPRFARPSAGKNLTSPSILSTPFGWAGLPPSNEQRVEPISLLVAFHSSLCF